jgi:hypothetical protein
MEQGMSSRKYNNTTYNKKTDPNGSIYAIDFSSAIQFSKYALFGMASYPFFRTPI